MSTVQWAGLAPGLVGLLSLIEVHRQLRRFWSAYHELQENHALVTTGVYRTVRHPMDSVLFVLLTGMALTSTNWLFMALPATRMVMFFERMRR